MRQLWSSGSVTRLLTLDDTKDASFELHKRCLGAVMLVLTCCSQVGIYCMFLLRVCVSAFSAHLLHEM